MLSRFYTYRQSHLFCERYLDLFTVRKRSCGKVTFLDLHLSVILFTGGSASVHVGIHTPWADTPPRQTPPTPRQKPPPPADGHCSGQYAPYWNAFLLILRVNSSIAMLECIEASFKRDKKMVTLRVDVNKASEITKKNKQKKRAFKRQLEEIAQKC